MSKAPPEASFVLVSEATDRTPAIVSIIKGGESCWYYVSTLPASWGTLALRLEKYPGQEGSDAEADSYDVMLDGLNSHCGCRGFLRWGQGKISAAAAGGDEHAARAGCKHLACLVWLLTEREYLPPPLGSFVDPEEPATPPADDGPPGDEPPLDDLWIDHGAPVGAAPAPGCPCCADDAGAASPLPPGADALPPQVITIGDCPDCGGSGQTAAGDCGTCDGFGSRQAKEWWAGRKPAPVSYLPEEDADHA